MNRLGIHAQVVTFSSFHRLGHNAKHNVSQKSFKMGKKIKILQRACCPAFKGWGNLPVKQASQAHGLTRHCGLKAPLERRSSDWQNKVEAVNRASRWGCFRVYRTERARSLSEIAVTHRAWRGINCLFWGVRVRADRAVLGQVNLKQEFKANEPTIRIERSNRRQAIRRTAGWSSSKKTVGWKDCGKRNKKKIKIILERKFRIFSVAWKVLELE